LADLFPTYGPTYGLAYRHGRFEALLGFGRKPVTQVTWDGALRFCQAQGGRLPTEAEWEFAARGTEGRRFPWGEKEPACAEAVYGRGQGKVCASLGQGPVAVGQTPPDRTPLGVYDLGGNVQEWVMDRFEPHYRTCQPPCVDPWVEDTPGSTRGARVVRGGSWVHMAAVCRSAGRSQWQQDEAVTNIGFRCAFPATR
jgi:formylglycine-generating enzyme required for sulfatase activity